MFRSCPGRGSCVTITLLATIACAAWLNLAQPACGQTAPSISAGDVREATHNSVTVDWTVIGDTKELNIHGAHLSPYCYPLAIDMIRQHQVPVSSIVTDILPLDDYAHAFSLVAKPQNSIKVVLEP